MARVFKAKYFPNCNILKAERNGGSSFIWSGIWAAKEEIKKGFRWVVGNGRDINVVSDPWLINKQDFMIDSGEVDLGSDIRVCHMFKANQQAWDVDVVASLFSREDTERILQMRIPRYETNDRLVWVFTKNC